MKSKSKVIATVLVSSLLVQFATPAFAMEDNQNNILENKNIEFKIEENLPIDKQVELNNLVKEFNMSKEDANYIKELYIQNHSGIQPKAKVGAVLKIIKVAKPIIIKGAKMFGMKMAEKGIADLTDYLFEWQGALQDGIENFLVNNWGWSTTAAHWVAKTIMFVAF